MEYDTNKAKEVLDRSFTAMKLPFHKDCSLPGVLEKCRTTVWGNSSVHKYHYFLADGSGSDIGGAESETHSWTLTNYLTLPCGKTCPPIPLYSRWQVDISPQFCTSQGKYRFVFSPTGWKGQCNYRFEGTVWTSSVIIYKKKSKHFSFITFSFFHIMSHQLIACFKFSARYGNPYQLQSHVCYSRNVIYQIKI